MVSRFFGEKKVSGKVKVCKGLCGEGKLIEEFDRMESAVDGLQSHCKLCHHYRHVLELQYRGLSEKVRLGHMTRAEAMNKLAFWPINPNRRRNA